MIPIPTLRTLVKAKHRRIAPLDAALRASRQQAGQRQAALEDADRHERSCREEEETLRSKLHGATTATGGLRGSDIVARQLYLDDAARRIVAAGKASQQAQRLVESAQQEVQAAQQALHRGQGKLERSREHLDEALRKLDQSQEDTQDEEAEEAAVARMSVQARQRSAAAA